MPNHNGKRLPDGTQPNLEDLRESIAAWTGEIAAKCRAYGMPAAVVLIVTPMDDPQPQYGQANLTAPGLTRILRHVADDVAANGGGIVVTSSMPKAKA